MRIDELIDAARDRGSFKSDRTLSAALGLNPASIHQFRAHKAWPADDTMIALAEMAGVDPVQALMELNIWRAKSPKVAQTYEAMRAKLAAIAASLVVMIGLASPAPAPAAQVGASSNMHYATKRRRGFGTVTVPKMAV